MTTSARTRIAGLAVACAAASAALAEDSGYPFCPVVDQVTEPLAALELGFVGRGAVERAAGDFGFVEERAHAEIGYYRTGIGDFQFTGFLRTWLTTGGEIAGLPDQFGQFGLRARWDLRTYQAFTFRADVMPGLYSDFEDAGTDDIAFPFALSAIQALSDRVAVQAGVSVYPGFDRVADPLVGIRWIATDGLLFDLYYPESRMLWQLAPAWSAALGVAVHRAWEFQLEDADPRDRFRYEDTRAYAGVHRLLGDTVEVTFRLGVTFDRRIEFTGGGAGEQDVDDALFLAFGLAALL